MRGCIIMTSQFRRVVLAADDVSLTPTYHSPEPSTSNTSKYWSLNVSDKGVNVDCRISTQHVTQKFNLERDVDKMIIHIHGLHHSGTGYIRKTLLDALNREFTPSSTALPVACIHDSLLPYRHVYKNKTKLYLDHHVTEDEGQHLQTVFPSFHTRIQPLNEAKSVVMGQAPKVAYLADFCLSKDDTENKQIGNILYEQWSRYWNVTSSTKFLLQKTPSLDVQFLESTKILPTLHVIIMRHPMTSNSWGIPYMSYAWAMAYHHVLELLNGGKVEWYAVVTYEALLEYRDVVVEELIEVVRSGIQRFGLDSIASEQLKMSSGNNNDSRFRRQLHLRDSSRINNVKKRANLWLDLPSNSYLIPKRFSTEHWKKCLKLSRCYQQLAHLTTDVLPRLGYVSIRKSHASLVRRINDGNATMSKTAPLTLGPSPATVSKEYGRVLFSSEGDALKLLRQRNSHLERNETEGPEYIGYPPPNDLIVKIAELLEKFSITPKPIT
ncbi:hypothetical protein ACHAXM_004208 [Skeletonema potamos]